MNIKELLKDAEAIENAIGKHYNDLSNEEKNILGDYNLYDEKQDETIADFMNALLSFPVSVSEDEVVPTGVIYDSTGDAVDSYMYDNINKLDGSEATEDDIDALYISSSYITRKDIEDEDENVIKVILTIEEAQGGGSKSVTINVNQQ